VLRMTNTTVSGNTATSYAGGGVLSSSGSFATITNSTITGNSAQGAGGIGNGGGTVTLANTIVAKNYRGSDTTTADDIFGDVTANFSFIGDPTGATITGENNRNGDPLLGPLADNGGRTQTHALLVGSPAIDAGDSVAGAEAGDFDQRGEGFDRKVYGFVDIGAFEFFATPTLSVSLSDGNLLITDGDATGKDNQLTISATGDFLNITDANESFDADEVALISGATLSNLARTLTIPLASITGTSITIDAKLGNDFLRIDDTHIDNFSFTSTAESTLVDTKTPDTLRAKSVTLNTDELTIVANIVADGGKGTVTIQPQTDGQSIDLGTEMWDQLSLTDTELDFISAGNLVIGNSSSGAITVSGDIDLTDEPTVATLHLNTAAGITSTDGGLKVSGLAINAVGAVTLNDADTAVSTVAITTSGAITINQSGALTVSTVGSQSGIDNSSGTGNVSLTSSAGGITVANGGLK
jgi:hypothetical protein